MEYYGDYSNMTGGRSNILVGPGSEEGGAYKEIDYEDENGLLLNPLVDKFEPRTDMSETGDWTDSYADTVETNVRDYAIQNSIEDFRKPLHNLPPSFYVDKATVTQTPEAVLFRTHKPPVQLTEEFYGPGESWEVRLNNRLNALDRDHQQMRVQTMESQKGPMNFYYPTTEPGGDQQQVQSTGMTTVRGRQYNENVGALIPIPFHQTRELGRKSSLPRREFPMQLPKYNANQLELIQGEHQVKYPPKNQIESQRPEFTDVRTNAPEYKSENTRPITDQKLQGGRSTTKLNNSRFKKPDYEDESNPANRKYINSNKKPTNLDQQRGRTTSQYTVDKVMTKPKSELPPPFLTIEYEKQNQNPYRYGENLWVGHAPEPVPGNEVESLQGDPQSYSTKHRESIRTRNNMKLDNSQPVNKSKQQIIQGDPQSYSTKYKQPLRTRNNMKLDNSQPVNKRDQQIVQGDPQSYSTKYKQPIRTRENMKLDNSQPVNKREQQIIKGDPQSYGTIHRQPLRTSESKNKSIYSNKSKSETLKQNRMTRPLNTKKPNTNKQSDLDIMQSPMDQNEIIEFEEYINDEPVELDENIQVKPARMDYPSPEILNPLYSSPSRSNRMRATDA